MMRENLLQPSSIGDWRTSLRSSPPYRIGNRTIRFNFHFAILIVSAATLILLFIYFNQGSKSSSDFAAISRQNIIVDLYNTTYPLTLPLLSRGRVETYRIGVVADLDTNSKIKEQDIWKSYLKKGYLTHNLEKSKISITWDESDALTLESGYSLKGRGMELSELVTYNGKLLTFDDRTGIVYTLQSDKVVPWVILSDGNGHNQKGFKTEWATVKDRLLYVGSIGKEWTTSQGDFENDNPMWIKVISQNGEIKNVDWSKYYKIMRSKIGITWPGYVIHESGQWSEIKRNWYFLPRRCSPDKYNETKDERMGCNVLISCDEYFSKILVTTIGKIKPTLGYSSFKFIPNTDDKLILAIKTEELNGKTSTFLTVFTTEGKILLDDEKVSDTIKYEGIEFI